MKTATLNSNLIRRLHPHFHATVILLYRYFCLLVGRRSGSTLSKQLIISVLLLITGVFSTNGSELSASQAESSICPEKRSVPGVLKHVGTRVESRLRTYFERAGVSYPPSRLTLIGLKDEMELEVWVEKDGRWVFITTYDIYAASGNRGPKQTAGDLQVPEGVYRITELNPNSRFHLSMKLDYPNEYDRLMAHYNGRSNLGGNIYIHGRAKSKGCLAVGDANIEELFVLAAKTELIILR